MFTIPFMLTMRGEGRFLEDGDEKRYFLYTLYRESPIGVI